MAPLTTFPSPRGPAAATASSQESVSVIVRLKGAPKFSSSTALLSYTVEDGTLATPRVSCRPSSQDYGSASPRLHTPRGALGCGSAAEPSVATSTSFPGADGGADVAAAACTEASKSPVLPVSQPRVFASLPTQTSKQQPLTPASPTMNSSPRPSLFAAEAPATHHQQEDRSPGASAVLSGAAVAGRSIGSHGRVLTITFPNMRERRKYEFGEVLEPEVTNAAMCERLIPSVMEQMAAGFNVCVLCYGQTGSGKTYTMNALAPAVAEEVFRSLDVNNEVVEMSYIQIYNNKAYNLLDGARSGKLGAELSRPLTSSTGTGNSGGNSCSASASEPKVLIRSSAEMLAKTKAALRLRVTHAHTLNARSSRSFILLSLHITRFLDGALLTTTRVTLADLAGTERLKKSGATGEAADQAIFINKSLMALRQLVESRGTEAEVLHFRESLLTTYLAPCMRSWHLTLLVTVSLEVGSSEETKSSLEFATNARRRKVMKVKSGVQQRLSSTVARLYGRPSFLSAAGGVDSGSGWNARADNADSSELQEIIEVLQYRIRVLEEALKIEQERGAMMVVQSPLTEVLASPSCAAPGAAVGAGVTPLANTEALQREFQYYRHLLQEREQDLRRLQSQLPETSAEAGCAPPVLPDSLEASSPLLDEGDAGARDDQEESATPPASARSSSSSDTQMRSGEGGAADAHMQLRRCVRQLRSLRSRGSSEDRWCDDVLDHLRNAVLRATEEYEDVNEQLLVISSSLSGLRTQNHRLYDEVLRANKRLLAIDTECRERCAALQKVTLRATAAETALEQLRLQLFQAYAEQSIREEMTRLYLDAAPIAANVDEAVSGNQQTEQQVELEKVQAHQQVLCDKITELVDNVEQLTRAVSQKDVSLAALESLITPAQRALFHTLSNTSTAITDRGTASVGGSDGGLARTTAAAMAADSESSAADCFSLLQSRVSELSSLLTQEQQQHQLTQCELLEAREDARRSRQEQRQAFFQQQEEMRRVGQLMAENYELRQQNERHQLYLDHMYVSFHETFLQLRHEHEEEMAELRSAAKVAPSHPRGGDDTARQGCEDEDHDYGASSATARALVRDETLQGVPSGEDRLPQGTVHSSTAVALSMAEVVDNGDAGRRASAPIQRSGRVRHRLTKSNVQHRGEGGGTAPTTTDDTVVADTAVVPSQRVGLSSKVARRSASMSKARRHLFATYGESANPNDAPVPLAKSAVGASAPTATRRRARASGAARGKRRK
ncbi:putative kinesin [Leishmania major strain Friedlin]|uniref:Putative kinesin n=1 Tax=Leishmania major TaxID=5664 RepID=Q4QDN6_LEIMA|nr:putative kinesin [Leishmania major strain Friedlin]CAG9572541.1 kinesin_-_putative [Leishmania major strain Friedlin]CAJ04295.1 putative kinesin [Leishmania major strain Friedlin]|eukprot:XP_001682562.1 putative kinesin [Leishmania major strain Friedlin]